MRRFLFVQFEPALGSAVLATPVYEALKKAVPDARITVIGSGFGYQLARYNPYVDLALEAPSPFNKYWAALHYFSTTVRLRNEEFDCIVFNFGNSRTKVTLLGIVAGIRWRLGFAVRPSLLHRAIATDPRIGVLQNNLRLLDLLGYQVSAAEPSVYFDRTDQRSIERWLAQQGIIENRPKVAFVTQTSGGHPNSWYADRFAAVGRALIAKHDAQIVFVGGKADVPSIEAVRRLIDAPTSSAAGATTIPALGALLCGMDLVVTVDTGTMHVARAVRVPTVVIGHAANPRFEWLPDHNDKMRILRLDNLPCVHCRRTFCATKECMDGHTVDSVIKAVAGHLARFPASARARMERLAASNGSEARNARGA